MSNDKPVTTMSQDLAKVLRAAADALDRDPKSLISASINTQPARDGAREQVIIRAAVNL